MLPSCVRVLVLLNAVFAAATLFRSASVISKSGCLQSTYICNSASGFGSRIKKNSECNINRLYPQLSHTARSLMIDQVSLRLHKDHLKEKWKGRPGFCYIEALVSSKGEMLFLRFDENRSLLTGPGSSHGMRELQHILSAFEHRSDGMQLVMDVNGQQVCSNLKKVGSSSSSDKQKHIFARFMSRSEVHNVPVDGSYTTFEFSTTDEDLKTVQPKVAAREYEPIDVAGLMLDRKSYPLTLWVYRCPVHLGILDAPCNSQVNAYILLSPWINQTRAHTTEGNFENYDDWRHTFLMEDMWLVCIMIAVTVYIAVHLHCIMWFGLAAGTREERY